jgi:hypothetical protein
MKDIFTIFCVFLHEFFAVLKTFWRIRGTHELLASILCCWCPCWCYHCCLLVWHLCHILSPFCCWCLWCSYCLCCCCLMFYSFDFLLITVAGVPAECCCLLYCLFWRSTALLQGLTWFSVTQTGCRWLKTYIEQKKFLACEPEISVDLSAPPEFSGGVMEKF